MKLLKNREIKINLAFLGAITLFASVAAFLWNGKFGIYVLCVCLLFILAYYVIMKDRYRKISELSLKINSLLHGDNTITFDEYSEGELCILKSELYKMTVCLREQRQCLQDDKVYLANSIADISHQIKTPLTSANLLLSLLSDENVSEKRRRELVRELYDLLSRIEWLITALLKMSKLDAGTVQLKSEKISLCDLLNKSVSTLLVPIELRGQRLILNATGDFYGDAQWTSEAISNIVKNCMEHTKSDGKIEITASETPLYSEIVIKDDGCGIANEDLPHIFERFYKGKDSDDKSFGIGLALARSIITSQNGSVKAENGRINGAVFTVKFYKGVV